MMRTRQGAVETAGSSGYPHFLQRRSFRHAVFSSRRSRPLGPQGLLLLLFDVVFSNFERRNGAVSWHVALVHHGLEGRHSYGTTTGVRRRRHGAAAKPKQGRCIIILDVMMTTTCRNSSCSSVARAAVCRFG